MPNSYSKLCRKIIIQKWIWLGSFFLFIWVDPATGQACNPVTFQLLIRDTDDRVVHPNVSPSDLLEALNAIQEKLSECASAEFIGKDSLEYRLITNIYRIAQRNADIEEMVDALNRLSRRPRIIEGFDPQTDLDEIQYQYGSLRIRYSGAPLDKMAFLKSVTDGDTVDVFVDILAPARAWDGDRNKEQKQKRIVQIRRKSLNGEYPLYFNSYNKADSTFYFEIPFIPYLAASQNPGLWYAITFDQAKRYRHNFSQNMTPEERTINLIPRANWILKEQVPEKYVLLIFDKSVIVKFKNESDGGKLLTKDEYIRIVDGGDAKYYIPSDIQLDVSVTYMTRNWYGYFKILSAAILSTALTYSFYLMGRS